ncbi:MAG: sulfotransferase family 2 domain-containing protein, partial [Gammaproteobacteria bacterium]|nr:sulfotransferase family 2 domain-containing protein [Gammaproteobacteria bacterium]
ALASTAARTPDLRAEKLVSRRYRFVWLCNPKVASRSLIAGLRAADPDAELVRHATFAEILAARPGIAGYTSFAFVRHPVARCFSLWRDKHALALRRRDAYRRFIEPWHGLAAGMDFAGFCRWLATPCGSDAFADRHWLSQHRQIRTAGGRLPDFIGAFERLDEDWRVLCGRLGIAHRALPRLNAGPAGGVPEDDRLDAGTHALLARRYAEDFRLGGYG